MVATRLLPGKKASQLYYEIVMVLQIFIFPVF